MQHLIYFRDFLLYCLPITGEYSNLQSKVYAKNSLPNNFFNTSNVFDYYFILDSKKLNRIGSPYYENVNSTSYTTYQTFRTDIVLDILIYAKDKLRSRYLAEKFISEIPIYTSNNKAGDFLINQTTFKFTNIIPTFEIEDLSNVESDDASYLRHRMTFPAIFSKQLTLDKETIDQTELSVNIEQ